MRSHPTKKKTDRPIRLCISYVFMYVAWLSVRVFFFRSHFWPIELPHTSLWDVNKVIVAKKKRRWRYRRTKKNSLCDGDLWMYFDYLDCAGQQQFHFHGISNWNLSIFIYQQFKGIIDENGTVMKNAENRLHNYFCEGQFNGINILIANTSRTKTNLKVAWTTERSLVFISIWVLCLFFFRTSQLNCIHTIHLWDFNRNSFTNIIHRTSVAYNSYDFYEFNPDRNW